MAPLPIATPARNNDGIGKRIGLHVAGVEPAGVFRPCDGPLGQQFRCAVHLRQGVQFGPVYALEDEAFAQRRRKLLTNTETIVSVGASVEIAEASPQGIIE